METSPAGRDDWADWDDERRVDNGLLRTPERHEAAAAPLPDGHDRGTGNVDPDVEQRADRARVARAQRVRQDEGETRGDEELRTIASSSACPPASHTTYTSMDAELAPSEPPAVIEEPEAKLDLDQKPSTGDPEAKPSTSDQEALDEELLLRKLGASTPPQSSRPQSAAADADDRQCRICLGGAEDEAEMGRMISPCLCSGSMRYVHLGCINEWRGLGANAKSFMECPQCGYEYHFRRTAVVGLATSRPLLLLITSVVFVGTALLVGHLLLKYLVAAVVASETLADTLKSPTADVARSNVRVAYYDGEDPEDDEYGYGSNFFYLGGTALIYDVVVQAIRTFVVFAGDVYDFFLGEDGTSAGGWVADLAIDLLVRLLLGLALLGSVSGLTLLASLSLFAPLQLVYALRQTGLLDGVRRRVNSRNGTLLVVAFVAIGVVNSVVQVYDIVQGGTRRALRYVETNIVEVHSPEARAARRAHQAPGWWGRWWAERRWRTAAGWSEVRLRAWVAAKEWARQWRAAVVEARHAHGQAAR